MSRTATVARNISSYCQLIILLVVVCGTAVTLKVVTVSAARPAPPSLMTVALTSTVLHFQGNTEDSSAAGSCTGVGSADVVKCGGPFLRADAGLSSNPAAHWDVPNPVTDGTADQNIYDPNWLWNSGPVRLGGPMTVEWWASCAACGGGVSADWTIRVWADGVKKFEQRINANPALPNVPAKLSSTLWLPEIIATNKVVLQIDPVFVDSQNGTHIFYDSQMQCPGATDNAPCDSKVTMPVLAPGDPVPTPSVAPTPNGTPAPPPLGTPRFFNYAAPNGMGTSAGEPSIGINWQTGKVFILSSFQALRVTFDDCPSPAKALWEDKSPRGVVSLDPIMFTDHMRAPGDNTPDRTFVSQLTGQDSITFFTDDDGNNYSPSQGGGIPSGVDHQTIGAGPYNANATPAPPPHPLYPNAVYYCSQDIGTAFCARSDNGGLTFGAGVPIYNTTQCTGIHGHVKVAPDGTAYVPNRSCDGHASVAVSKDNGITWIVKEIPTSGNTGFLVDPSVGIGANNVGKPNGQASNTIYLGYQHSDHHARIAVSHDQGNTWVNDQEVGTEFGLTNMTFPEVVAGDDNRAAYAFLGTKVPGDYTDQANYPQDAPWHLYIATTFDGGVTWTTIDATPTDPVQRGSICNLGTTTCNGHDPNDRNLLDFMDATVDAQGRTLVGYPDGCIGACVNNPTGLHPNSYTAVATIARQAGGKRLFAAFDPNPAEPQSPAPPRVDSVSNAGTGIVRVQWSAPDNGGSPITGYHVFRRAPNGTYGAPVATLAGTTYDDTAADPNTQYFYKVTAMNAVGEGLSCGEFQVGQTQTPCVLPGLSLVNDSTGDQVGAQLPQNADLDIQSISAAEPYFADGSQRLVFTMKVADLTTIPPNRQWRIIWTPPTPPTVVAGQVVEDRYFVGMNSNTGGASAMSFEYGVVASQGSAARTIGSAASDISGTVNAATGVIQITVKNSVVGNVKAGDLLSAINGRSFAGTGEASFTPNSAIDTTTTGQYTLVGNAACRPNTAPFAALTATPSSGNVPLAVNFDGSGSSDPDAGDSIAAYTFDFGDGAQAVTQATPLVAHTYNAPGNYNATLRVTDSHGLVSSNVAQVLITANAVATRTNYALATNGGTAIGSTEYASGGFPAASAINGDRTGGNWGGGAGGWNDNTRDLYDDWLEVDFNSPKTIDEIKVFTLQDAYTNAVEPTPDMTCTVYGLLDFEVQTWDGTTWVTVSNGSITNNVHVINDLNFPAVTTQRLRVLVHNARAHFSRIVEVEAYGASGQ